MKRIDTGLIIGIYILAAVVCVAVLRYSHKNKREVKEWGLPVAQSDKLSIDLPVVPITAGKIVRLPVRNLEGDAVDSARVFCFPEATCFPCQWQGQTNIVFQSTTEQCYTVLIVADGEDGYKYDIVELFVGGKEDGDEEYDETKPTPDKAERLLIGIVYDPEERDNQREWLEVLTSKDIRTIDRTTVEFISVNTKDPELQKWAVRGIDNRPTLIIANEQGKILSAEILPTDKATAVQKIRGYLK